MLVDILVYFTSTMKHLTKVSEKDIPNYRVGFQYLLLLFLWVVSPPQRIHTHRKLGSVLRDQEIPCDISDSAWLMVVQLV